jgi:ABC-type enterobactin transport system permease subunit
LGKANWEKLAISTPLIVVGTGFLCWKARDLNILNAGDATTKSLGVNVGRTRVAAMIVCTLMVAGIVSFTGTIGFIGEALITDTCGEISIQPLCRCGAMPREKKKRTRKIRGLKALAM